MAEMSNGKRIVVDWDGTCVENKYPAEVPLLEGAADALHSFLAQGYEVVIFSCRLSHVEMDEVTPLPEDWIQREREYIRRTLDEAGLQAVYIWDAPWKPSAVLYIDDKGLRFYDWQQVVRDVDALFPAADTERMI